MHTCIQPLKEVTAPEEKRKIIGDTFIKVAERAMASLGIDSSSVFLAQGTLRPDLIESASALARCADVVACGPLRALGGPCSCTVLHAHTHFHSPTPQPFFFSLCGPHSSSADAIKTHHNDTALVRKLREEGKVVEPLKDYHKDEVCW